MGVGVEDEGSIVLYKVCCALHCAGVGVDAGCGVWVWGLVLVGVGARCGVLGVGCERACHTLFPSCVQRPAA